jgi:hypothetical protein
MEHLYFHLINIQASEYIWVKDRFVKIFKNEKLFKYKLFLVSIFDPKNILSLFSEKKNVCYKYKWIK